MSNRGYSPGLSCRPPLRALIDVKKGLQRGVTDIPGTHTLPTPLHWYL